MEIEKYINREALHTRLEGDVELFKDLAYIFLKDSTSLMQSLEEAVKDKDSKRIFKGAHTLKGSLLNFSAEAAVKAAIRVEDMGKENRLDEVEKALASLKDVLNNTRTAIRELIEMDTI